MQTAIRRHKTTTERQNNYEETQNDYKDIELLDMRIDKRRIYIYSAN